MLCIFIYILRALASLSFLKIHKQSQSNYKLLNLPNAAHRAQTLISEAHKVYLERPYSIATIYPHTIQLVAVFRESIHQCFVTPRLIHSSQHTVILLRNRVSTYTFGKLAFVHRPSLLQLDFPRTTHTCIKPQLHSLVPSPRECTRAPTNRRRVAREQRVQCIYACISGQSAF